MQTPGQIGCNAALEFLGSRIDYERALSVPYSKRDFRLDRMRDLLARLGNPHEHLRIVHVAGTKGKGSTAAMLAGVLTAANFRTGLYSSPHLDRVEERLAIDGHPCTAVELAELVSQVRPVVESMDAQIPDDELGSTRPTYFEIVTAMALLHFARRQVHVAVLEVGMGGRLDSTNVCQPMVCVITSISFDHTQQLGTTLAAIAGEKAGIVKPCVPVVSGVLADEPRDVIAAAARAAGSRLVEAGRDFTFAYRPGVHAENMTPATEFDFSYAPDATQNLIGGRLSLLGRHQAANAAVALATLAELRRLGFDVSEDAVRRGLRDVRWPARIEILRWNPLVVLDAAHNVASAQALAQVLAESFSAARRILVFATTRDKDWPGMLEVLLPGFDEVVFTRYWSNPRGTPPEELSAVAEEIAPLQRHICPDSVSAWRLVQERSTTGDLICIAGSFFIAAEMRAAINDDRQPSWNVARDSTGITTG